VGRPSRTVLGRAAAAPTTQTSRYDRLVRRGVALDRHCRGVRHRPCRLAVEFRVGFTSFGELAVVRLAEFPVRIGHLAIWIGTLPFGSGGFSFGSGSSGSNPSASGAPADSAAIALRVDPGLVDVDTSLGYANEEAAGTGIVLTSTGEVLTNNHVVDGATSIRVTDVGNGRVYTATVVGYDRSSDVAVLKLKDAAGLKVASLGDSSMVRRGEAVVGIGNAGGIGGTPSAAGGSVYSSRPVDHRYGTRWRQPREV